MTFSTENFLNSASQAPSRKPSPENSSRGVQFQARTPSRRDPYLEPISHVLSMYLYYIHEDLANEQVSVNKRKLMINLIREKPDYFNFDSVSMQDYIRKARMLNREFNSLVADMQLTPAYFGYINLPYKDDFIRMVKVSLYKDDVNRAKIDFWKNTMNALVKESFNCSELVANEKRWVKWVNQPGIFKDGWKFAEAAGKGSGLGEDVSPEDDNLNPDAERAKDGTFAEKFAGLALEKV